MSEPRSLKGIIFVVDSATLSAQEQGLREAAEYLHDILLLLQQGLMTSKSLKASESFPVLIAAHKADLFTALPPTAVKNALEAEISHVRASKARGLLDSGIDSDDVNAGSENEWLGERRDGNFKFTQMQDFSVEIMVEGGYVLEGDTADIGRYWSWIGSNL